MTAGLAATLGLGAVGGAWAAAGDASGSGSGSAVRFVEVAEAAGIDFRYVNGASGEKYMPESMGSGAAFFDADGDGGLDLYIVNGAAMPGYQAEVPPANALYRNLRDGTFRDVTAVAAVGDTGYGMGAAVGDYDNDGDRDLYVTNVGPNRMYRNRGDGVFDEVGGLLGVDDPGWGANAAFADYDRDGDLDLYVANYLAYSTDANRRCWRGSVRAYCGPGAYAGQSGRLYRNDGPAGMRDVAREAGVASAAGRQLGAVWGDVDDDGDSDLFIANDTKANFLFLNRGDGTFEEAGITAGVAHSGDGTPQSAMGTDMADYDNDGRLDIVVATFQWLPNTLYHSDGDGFFTDVSFAVGLGTESVPYLGMTSAFLDYDNDGHLDLFVANGHLDENVKEYDPAASYAQQNQLFRNRGDGTFAEVSDAVGPGMELARVSHGAALGDYDDDGDVDIFVSDSDTPRCSLLRNDGGSLRGHVVLVFQGRQSNREGIGARVRAVAGNLVQTREVRRDYGYLGSNDVRLILGLGDRPRIDTLEVRWPSGIRQVVTRIPAGQVLTLQEETTP
ncbi:MAG: CRTAC1 family protein [Gemmatimonadota bacterium]